ncbi:MAG: thioesterase family protein [Bryobacteraceae bacterium]|jgi:acyl-CoA thioester hydrolase
MRPVTETRLRVRYAETDQMGVVYYANYFVWMEVGRVGYCKACGFNYRDMERDDGVFLAVAEADCRYKSPAKFDDEVIVKTWIEDANTRIVIFHYEMRVAEEDRLLATGMTRHVFVNHQMQRSRMPEKYYSMFGIATHQETENPPSALAGNDPTPQASELK